MLTNGRMDKQSVAQLHKGKSDSNAKKFCNTREIGESQKQG